jgi:hypothetical protein
MTKIEKWEFSVCVWVFGHWEIGITWKIASKSPHPPFLKGGEGGLSIFIVRG